MRARVFLGILGALVALGLVAVAYTAFIVVDGMPGGAFTTASDAMSPTLVPGDRFTVRNLGARSAIERDALVAHEFPGNASILVIKRIVGLPGDTIAMQDGQLEINRHAVREPFAWRAAPDIDPVVDDFRWQRAFLINARDTLHYIASRNTWGPLVVPRDRYFVLGDNRDNSLDSRYFGFVTADELVGRVRRIYFSQDSTGHVRWSRLGTQPH